MFHHIPLYNLFENSKVKKRQETIKLDGIYYFINSGNNLGFA